MNEELEGHQNHAKRQGDKYAEKRADTQAEKMKRELQADTNYSFKREEMFASLLSNQRNFTMFHAFTTACCVKENQPARNPLHLPAIPQLATVVIGDELLDAQEKAQEEAEDRTNRLPAGQSEEGGGDSEEA